MKVCAMSDLHGQIENVNTDEIKNIDCVFICGDIVPLKIQHNNELSMDWLKDNFIPWCESLDCKHVFFIAGNHDFFLEGQDDAVKALLNGTKITYLNNETAEYHDDNADKTFKIFGSPDTHKFGNWAFMFSSVKEIADFNKMTDDCDIMLTHDAAYGQNDVCLDNYVKNHIGNIEMTRVLMEKHPRFHFTGHLHSSNHTLINYNGTLTACVSLLNESYKMAYQPLILDID